MGQYFIAALLDTTGRITRAVHPVHYGSLHKLGGHSRAATPFLAAVETLLSLDSGSRLVWAGDEADPEPGQDANLYWLAEPHQFVRFADLIDPDSDVEPNATRPAVTAGRRYVCNTDRSEYFDKTVLPRGPTVNRETCCPPQRPTDTASPDRGHATTSTSPTPAQTTHGRNCAPHHRYSAARPARSPHRMREMTGPPFSSGQRAGWASAH
jgi:hypothetical protein